MKQFNSDTNAMNKKYLKEIQEKRKEETFSSEKMKIMKMPNIKKSKNEEMNKKEKKWKYKKKQEKRSGMRGGSSNVLGHFLRYEQHACLLVEMLARPCGTRLLEQASGAGHEREEEEYEWHGFWRGCWGQGGCEVCAGGSRDGHS